MKTFIQFFIYFFLLFAVSTTQAQDLHFSQYFNTPLLVNPANTGFNPDYDYRIGGNYRNQWATVASNPYKTMNVWGDVQLFTNRYVTGWAGLGGTIYKDQAGSGNLSSTRGYISMAYHQMLGYESLLSFGVNVGAVNKRVDFGKLTFDNQWNGKFFDVNAPTGEQFVTNSVTYLDVQVGLNYAWFASDRAYLNLGMSAAHINKGRESFFAENAAVNQHVPVRYTAFMNANFKTADNLWILNPNVYVSKSETSYETVVGINANRNLSGDGNTQLILGVYYRNNDAIIPMIGYQLNDLKLTFNYDATTSSLGSFNGRQGAYEVSIVKSGVLNGAKGIKCPTVKF